ncbi:hypothetical protein BDZ97DRAFT_1757467 [Flammula alnicola]|nr:hypothetical protein BDZ97DRAFT_1757467 [Flammula alnicola]
MQAHNAFAFQIRDHHELTYLPPLFLRFTRPQAPDVLYGHIVSTPERPHGPLEPVLCVEERGRSAEFTNTSATHQNWAEISYSPTDGREILAAPSLGIQGVLLSNFLDDISALFPGRRGAYSMRTRYGCQHWECDLSLTDRIVVRTSYQQSENLGVTFGASHPQGWPFSFELAIEFLDRNSFDLEVAVNGTGATETYSDTESDNLVYAAVLAAYIMNQTIWNH